MSQSSAVIDIPQCDRLTDNGHSVSSALIVSSVNFKLAYPTATNAMIAEAIIDTTGPSVGRALRTVYARRALAILTDNPFQVAIAEATGDSLCYTAKAVRRGTKELSELEPNTSVLTAANQAAGAYIKGILPDRLEVTHRAIDATRYNALDELEGLIGQEAEPGHPGSVDEGERLTGHTSDGGSET